MISDQILNQILEALYEAPLEPSRWDEFLKLTAATVDGRAAALMLHFSDAQSLVARQCGLDPAEQQPYEQHYYKTDIWAKAARNTPDWAVSSECLVPFFEFERSEFCNDFLSTQKIMHGLFVVMEQGPTQLSTLSLFRTHRDGPFGNRDTAFARFLSPHIKRAHRLHSELASARTKNSGLLATLDLISSAVILVGAKMQVIAMNAAADRLLKASDGLKVSSTGVRAERSSDNVQLHKLIAAAVATSNGEGQSAGGTMTVSRRELPPLSVLVSPFGEYHRETRERVGAILFVNDPAQIVRPAQDTLRRMFGLTTAEACVAEIMLQGVSIPEIAEMRGVSPNTVKSQAKSIFLKTGVRRQGELVGLLTRTFGPMLSQPSDSKKL